ncbi:hypothetical protein HHI36_018531, partial [Cryptolaemus montrouzieri]
EKDTRKRKSKDINQEVGPERSVTKRQLTEKDTRKRKSKDINQEVGPERSVTKRQLT